MADRRRALTVAGLALLGLGAVLASQAHAATTSGAKPPPAPPGGKVWPLVRAGSASLRRPAWVHDHGCNAPLYNGTSGGLVKWIPCGTVLRTVGAVAAIPHLVINANGSTNGMLGRVPSYPVAGGWLSVTDVDVIAG